MCYAGELLNLAAELLREGLHTAEILEGYRAAYAKAQEILPTLVCHTVGDMRDEKQLAFAVKATIASKQYGFEVKGNTASRLLLMPIISHAFVDAAALPLVYLLLLLL